MSDGCGGCSYCEFPYEAQLPVKTEKGYEKRTFKKVSDVWAVINLIVQETKKFNSTRDKQFDIAKSVISQIPFFTCINHIRNEKYLKLLTKYLYCTETNTPAYSGSYGEQPATWIEYFFIIKNALAKKERNMQEKAGKETKVNG